MGDFYDIDGNIRVNIEKSACNLKSVIIDIWSEKAFRILKDFIQLKTVKLNEIKSMSRVVTYVVH